MLFFGVLIGTETTCTCRWLKTVAVIPVLGDPDKSGVLSIEQDNAHVCL